MELLWEVNPLPVYMGGGVGGLLLLLLISLGLAKVGGSFAMRGGVPPTLGVLVPPPFLPAPPPQCGFFRRNYRERMEQEGEREEEGEEEEEGGGHREGEGSLPSGDTPKGETQPPDLPLPSPNL